MRFCVKVFLLLWQAAEGSPVRDSGAMDSCLTYCDHDCIFGAHLKYRPGTLIVIGMRANMSDE